MDPDLAEYVRSRSHAAFEGVVRRHVDAVYAQAARQLRDPDAARDVTQGVFALLAGRAERIPPRAVLGGWLHNATRYACLNHQRAQARRRKHEHGAATMRPESTSDLPSTKPDAPFEHAAAVLDDALAELKASDRDALVLRYFQSQSTAQIARALDVSEDAAKQRVSRAVDRLRRVFARRGVTASSVATVGGWLDQMAGGPAPLDVVTGAIAAGSAATVPAAAAGVAKGTASLMAWAKAKVVAGVAVAVVAAGGGVAAIVAQTDLRRAATPVARTAPAALGAQPAPAAPLDAPPAGEVEVDPQLLGEWEPAEPRQTDLAVPDDLTFTITQTTIVHDSPAERVVLEIAHCDPDASPPELDVLIREITRNGRPETGDVGKRLLMTYRLGAGGRLDLVTARPGAVVRPTGPDDPNGKVLSLRRKALRADDGR